MPNEPVRYEPNAPVKTQGTLRTILDSDAFKHALAEVAPKHLTPERVVKMVLLAASRQPKLLQCSQESLLKAAMSSSELGLDCSGTLGRAWLVPFMNNKTSRMEALFMIGTLGLMDLARRSGEIESISASVVYKQDGFHYEKGLEERLKHIPDYTEDHKDSDIVGAYAIIRFKNGGHHIEYMPRKEIEKVRAVSKAKDSGPWKSWYSEMCKKSALRRALKYAPMSVQLQQAVSKTDEEFDLSTVEMKQELKETDGRQKWGFTETEPEPEEPEQETIIPNEVDSEARRALLSKMNKALNARNVKAKASRDKAMEQMYAAAGVRKLDEIQTIEALNAADAFIEENFGIPEEE